MTSLQSSSLLSSAFHFASLLFSPLLSSAFHFASLLFNPLLFSAFHFASLLFNPLLSSPFRYILQLSLHSSSAFFLFILFSLSFSLSFFTFNFFDFPPSLSSHSLPLFIQSLLDIVQGTKKTERVSFVPIGSETDCFTHTILRVMSNSKTSKGGMYVCTCCRIFHLSSTR